MNCVHVWLAKDIEDVVEETLKEFREFKNNKRYERRKIMPFYIKGLNKNSGKGKVFKANVWFWRPLWCYVCFVCEGILD
jgi:hypothetical protein